MDKMMRGERGGGAQIDDGWTKPAVTAKERGKGRRAEFLHKPALLAFARVGSVYMPKNHQQDGTYNEGGKNNALQNKNLSSFPLCGLHFCALFPPSST